MDPGDAAVPDWKCLQQQASDGLGAVTGNQKE